MGSYEANLRLINDRVAPVSSIAGTANPCVYTDKYSRPRCVCTLLSKGVSTFPCLPYVRRLHQFPCSFALFVPMLLNFCLLITRCWLPVRSSFVVRRPSGCFRTIPGDVSCFSAIITRRSSCLARALYVIHLSSYWKFPEGLKRSLHLESVLHIFFQLQRNCHDFV